MSHHVETRISYAIRKIDRIGLLIETFGQILGFMEVAAIHELIGTFSHPEKDNSYAYLACIVLFLSDVGSTMASALVR